MKINVKVLKGAECKIDADNETSILQVKQRIENVLNIPISHQKLLYIGRTLMNDKFVKDYNINELTKLTLVVKQPESIKDLVRKYFRKYYNEQQTERLTEEFIVDFENKIKNSYSLDDLEKIASNILGVEK